MEWLIYAIIWIAPIVWIYQDAKKRNLKAAASWAFFAFFFGIFGLLGYLLMIVRPNRSNI